VWWNNDIPKWLASNRGSNSSAAGGPDGAGVAAAGEFAVWHNLNHKEVLPGSQTLLTFLADPQSSVYEGMPDEAVKTELLKRLKLQHPDVTIPQPSDFFISRHGYDINSYGAYSISFAGWDDANHPTLAQPATACGKVRIRLAGEAMCDDLNGYTHGAYQSGRESAAQFLFTHGLGPDPALDGALSLCNH
jgi:monoamine oxidase